MAKSIADFIRETRQETRKVTWPTRKETTVTTVVVFVMIIAMSLILLGVDGMISSVVKFILALGAQ